jgi:hypothetical protein
MLPKEKRNNQIMRDENQYFVVIEVLISTEMLVKAKSHQM